MNMSEKDYAKGIIDCLPEERMDDVIAFLLNQSDEANDNEKFEVISKHILEKYHKAFEELAK